MIKSLINVLIRDFPTELIPFPKAKTFEGRAFDDLMKKLISHANQAFPRHADRTNFMELLKMIHASGLYLIENDSFYRTYVRLALEHLKKEED